MKKIKEFLGGVMMGMIFIGCALALITLYALAFSWLIKHPLF